VIRRPRLPALILAAVGAVAQAAGAAPLQAVPKASATVGLVTPLSVVWKDDLEFGFLAAGTTAGTAVVDPNSGVLTTTGGVLGLGGNPHPAQFIGASQSANVVLIKLPNGAITLTRAGGTETMSLTSLTLQGQSKRTLAAMESFTFNVGGTLNVAANQREGFYTGTFDVQIQYP
jgi:Domain of unknown function (DUF4402)